MRGYVTIRKKTLYGCATWLAIVGLLSLAALFARQYMSGQKPLLVETKPSQTTVVDSTTIAARIAALDKQIEEMEYYRSVHNVQDEGFDMVMSHETTILSERDSLKNLLAKITDSGKPQLVIERKATIADIDSVPTSDIFVATKSGVWHRLSMVGFPRCARGIAYDNDSNIIIGVWHADTLAYGRRTDSLGTYRGAFNSEMQACGYGTIDYHDGSFYAGNFTTNKRNGFGFSISAEKLRAGEWKDDKFKGERMNYSSNRIYGIDISRYQHGKGRKYYPISWKNLRITSLGRIKRKNVSGTVDYPVSFVYIKSTEGTTVRNRHFLRDYRDARRNGFHVGAYHFFSTRTGGTAQARYFLRHTRFSKGDFPPVLDCEPSAKQIAKMGGAKAMFKEIRAWMNAVSRSTGVRPILYVSQTFVNKYLDQAPDIKRDYNVWIARYGDYKPDVKLVYWQLCADGKVSGIHGDVDINVFNGYEGQFQEFIEGNIIR